MKERDFWVVSWFDLCLSAPAGQAVSDVSPDWSLSKDTQPRLGFSVVQIHRKLHGPVISRLHVSVIPPKEGRGCMLPPYHGVVSLMWSLECIRPFDVVVFSTLPPSVVWALREALRVTGLVPRGTCSEWRDIVYHSTLEAVGNALSVEEWASSCMYQVLLFLCTSTCRRTAHLLPFGRY